MTAGDNAAAMRTHAAHSTARETTARALVSRWQHLARSDGDRPRICDLGTGDGQFLDQVLTELGITAVIEIVEPDEDLAPAAQQRLRAHGHHVTRISDAGSCQSVDAYLAAHVLFYLPDIDDWFASAIAQLNAGGTLSIVQRAPTCDGNALRALVRHHHGIAPKVTSTQLQRLAAVYSMTTDVVSLSSTFSYPTAHPHLAPIPAESADPELARLLCWLAGLPTHQPLPASLRHKINGFLTYRHVDGVLVLNQHDLLITSTRTTGTAAPAGHRLT